MKLSIVIPMHNVEIYVEKLLNGIFKQTFKDFEVICILDSCTDNTEEIVKKYPVRIFECKYKQPGFTRNIGLNQAKGEWIWCLDADDWLLTETAFEQVVAQLSDDISVLTIKNYDTPDGISSQYITTTMWSNVLNSAYLKSIGNLRFKGSYYDEDMVFLFGYEALGGPRYKQKFWENETPLYFYNFPRIGSVRFNYNFGKNIVLAFSGCGKTMYCYNNQGWMDLDLGFGLFDHQNELAVELACHFAANGWKVMLPASLPIIQLMRKLGLWVNLILPGLDMKDEIIDRVRRRNGEPDWLHHIEKEYDAICSQMFKYANPDNLKILRPGQYVSDAMQGWNLEMPTLRPVDERHD